MDDMTPQLFRTATGRKLHLQECPHVLGAELIAADAGTHEICTWCLAEVSGVGRTIHTSIDEALRDLGAPEVSLRELAGHLRGVEHDLIYVPFSRAYVAVAKNGLGMAWAGKTYVAFRGHATVFLSDYVGAARGAGAAARDSWGGICDRHFVQRSVDGTCEQCL